MTPEDGYTIEDCEYQVGDFVTISDGVRKCSFGTNSEMIDDIGRTFEVQYIKKCHNGPRIGRHESRFLIQLIDRGWNYDENCFEPSETKDRVFDAGDMSILFA